MNELEALRKEIDRVDRAILPLFLERMELCGGVADYKRKVGMPVFDPVREKQVLENKLKLLDGGEMAEEVYEFFNSVMTISRVRQNRMLTDVTDKTRCADILAVTVPKKENPRVVYFGTEGAYSEAAAISCFGKDCDRFSAPSFEAAFEALADDSADYAALPIENSSTGTIAEVADLLIKYSYYITGEVYVPVRHCLLGTYDAELSDIKRIYSHEQAVLQCGDFIKKLGGAECETHFSTALAAKTVSEKGDKSIAAIADARNAEIYSLKILARDINSSEGNTTRFVVISKRPEAEKNADKISAAFTLKHESGQLYQILSGFARGGLNLLKLESRPIPEKPFEYRFFVDYSGNLADAAVRSITDTAIEETMNFTLLGNYPAGSVGE